MRNPFRWHTIIIETRLENHEYEILVGDALVINDREGHSAKVTVEKDRRIRIRFNPDEMTSDVVPAAWETESPLESADSLMR